MIYVHVPFCRSFCTYCDFYSEIACKGKDEGLFSSYADSLCREIDRRRSEIEETLSTHTLYIGGGTPSVLPLTMLRRIVEKLGYKNYTEFTLELNPDDVTERSYLEGLASLGVNRVSMGVQTLDDKLLKWMNRRHDSSQALAAFDLLREFFENISLDLIFGLSILSTEALDRTIDEFIALRPNHISAYQLSVESGSALATMVRQGTYAEASDEACEAQYALICRRLAAAGYVHYEISSWALPGFEAVHNSAYWNRAPYVGLGPGAHSFDGAVRSWNSENLSSWISSFERLTPLEAREEEVMLGLRTAAGVASELLDPNIVEDMLRRGLLLRMGTKIRIPENKFFTSDDIIAQLI